ncbi:MAG: C39 family peptidase [Lentisphaeria bacterium]|nr:C39 family peptidase [Lentisphaeria bacterium]
MNECLGIDLFGAGDFWQEPAERIGKRLGLALVSGTDEGTIRKRSHVPVLGGKASEVRLLADPDGFPLRLELNLVNKGDFFAPASGAAMASNAVEDSQRDRVRRFRREWDDWQGRAEASLTKVLGTGRRQSFTQGERQRVTRWDWSGAAFLLDAREGEFVMLRILPAAVADAGGRSARLSDRDIKERLQANVTNAANGDVVIGNIPMVDQGAKGYCAAATAERILRYYGIEVDSHELADIAQTGRGGGTTWSGMCEAIQKTAGRNQRQLRTVPGTVSVKLVRRYVDKGIPLVWGLFLVPEVEELARRRTGLRQDAEPREWGRRVRKEARDVRRIQPNRSPGHVRLIVGYNDTTREVAYSDSWGDTRVYWLGEDEAEHVSFPGTCLATVIP